MSGLIFLIISLLIFSVSVNLSIRFMHHFLFDDDIDTPTYTNKFLRFYDKIVDFFADKLEKICITKKDEDIK